ncbi:MAG: hypothetical protein Q7V63_06940 [Gammaproteobacteria bacterium]|nr:hypothetical protein [Gammaproteobacteria bacterium]
MFKRLFANKKCSHSKTLNRKELINHFLLTIVKDEQLNIPMYCPNIKSKEHARTVEKQLPLAYIWSENSNNAICVSINGYVVKQLLEARYNINEKDFNLIRDELMVVMVECTSYTVSKLCEESGLFPSQIFAHLSNDVIKRRQSQKQVWLLGK